MSKRKRIQRNHISNKQRAEGAIAYAQHVRDGGPKRDQARIKVVPQRDSKDNGVH